MSRRRGDDSAAHTDMKKLWAGVGLTFLEQLLSLDDFALPDADVHYVPRTEAMFCD